MSKRDERVDLINRAIRSAQARVIFLKSGSAMMLRYPGQDEDMIAKEEITIKALEFYKNYFYGEE